MSETVLVLGNGISRLLFAAQIVAWHGEVWGCNRAYLEPDIGPKLTRLTGHADVLAEAATYRDTHEGLRYVVWGGKRGPGIQRLFTIPDLFRHDSGTTLVAQALEDGLNVAAAGFDLGGPDIHSVRLWKQRKSTWIKRWRQILQHYGWERVTFWGHDHMPYLKSGETSSTYADAYTAGRPHLPESEYQKLYREWYEREREGNESD